MLLTEVVFSDQTKAAQGMTRVESSIFKTDCETLCRSSYPI